MKGRPRKQSYLSENITISARSCSVFYVQTTGYSENEALVIENLPYIPGTQLGTIVATVHSNKVLVSGANYLDHPVTIPAHTALGTVVTVQEDLAQEAQCFKPPYDISRDIEDKLSYLQPPQRNQLKEVLLKHEFDLGYCSKTEHRIDTGDHALVVIHQWRLPRQIKYIIEQHCQNMLRAGIIEPCRSPWRAPVLFVRNKPGGNF